MQKYSSNIQTSSGSAVRGASVEILDEAGDLASIYGDRNGTIPMANPLESGPDGRFSFYAVSGRYSIRTTISGRTVTDLDSVLLLDPDDPSGPIEGANITANTALTTANAAASEAATAASDAATALATANAASDTANAIADTANDAASDAANALAIAGAASTTANNAEATANAIAGTANDALTTANDAETTANAAAAAVASKENAITAGTTSQYWRGDKSWQTLNASAVGLGNVNNTSDANKPVSAAQQAALNLKADDSAVVKLTGTQTVAGAKTFSSAVTTTSGSFVGTTGTGGYAMLTTVAGSTAGGGAFVARDSASSFNPGGVEVCVGGFEALRITSSGTIISRRGALGYGTDAGGQVTQTTSKATTVTLNKPCGTVVTHNSSLAAGAAVSFQFLNSFVEPADVIAASVAWGAGPDPVNYEVRIVPYIIAGTMLVILKNVSGVSLGEAVVINFAIIKAVRA